MKTINKNIIITALVMLVVGMGLGSLIFGGQSEVSGGHDHTVAEQGQIWTCSMHPQIRLPQPGKCPLCGMELIPLQTGSSDDDPLVLKSVQNLLQRQGYELACAKSAEDAEAHLESNTPNLIICDIRMPRVDGISFLQRLKAKSPQEGASEIPVIFVTGYASEEAPIDALKLGAKDYILKPFDLDDLLESVKKHAT